jgi:transcriptional regulator with XRE-family HTH domain
MAADLVRQARERSGLSQRALAERAGVPQSVVARAESASHNPSLRTVERLLAAAGARLTLEELPDAHDLSLLDATLALTVEQRIDRLLAVTAFAAELQAAARP